MQLLLIFFYACLSSATSTFCVGAENEPDGVPEDWMRIAELQARNKACLPHLKSSYPVEFDVSTEGHNRHTVAHENDDKYGHVILRGSLSKTFYDCSFKRWFECYVMLHFLPLILFPQVL